MMWDMYGWQQPEDRQLPATAAQPVPIRQVIPGGVPTRRLVVTALAAGRNDFHRQTDPQDRFDQEGVQETAGHQRHHGNVDLYQPCKVWL